jgi:hypothetical protein
MIYDEKYLPNGDAPLTRDKYKNKIMKTINARCKIGETEKLFVSSLIDYMHALNDYLQKNIHEPRPIETAESNARRCLEGTFLLMDHVIDLLRENGYE